MVQADVAQATELLNHIIRAGGTTAMQEELTPAAFEAKFLRADDVLCCHVALDPEGAVAGFQLLNWYDALPEGCADISSFARQVPVLKGVGRALFPVTCAAARAAGATQINATIRADNVPGLAYYTKMGFVDHAVAKAVPLRDGRPVDRISKRFALTA